jgi:hypothetical protein
MKSKATKILWVLFLFALGCSSQGNSRPTSVPESESNSPTMAPSICEPKIYTWEVPNGLIFPSPPSDVVTWDTYRELQSISEKNVKEISIEYVYLGWDIKTLCTKISSTWSGYRTEDGKPVEKERVMQFANSLINLRRSGGNKICVNHTDDYPNFRVEIEYRSGEKAVLYSQTNCTKDRSPWNVVYEGKMYFQSTGEIPQALYALIESFDDTISEWWSPDLAGTYSYGDGSEFFLVTSSHPPEIDRLTFSEEEIFMDAIVASGVLEPHLSTFEMDGVQLSCPMHTDCSDVTGQARLKSENNLSYLMNVHFNQAGEVILEDKITVAQLLEADRALIAHPIIQMARAAKTDLEIYVDCWVETKCDEQAWCSAMFANVGASPSSEELACEVNFRIEYPQQFIFLPDINQFWVKKLLFDLDETKASKNNNTSFPNWKPRIEALTSLFEVKNDSFMYDYAHSIRVFDDEKQCNGISLNYNAIAWDNGSVHRFRYRLADHYGYDRVPEGGINILGYCVFVSPNGEFVLYQP